jgi:hypothetical protein
MMSLTPASGGPAAGGGCGGALEPGAVELDGAGAAERELCCTTGAGRAPAFDGDDELGIGEVAATGETELELGDGVGPSTPPTKIVRADPISAGSSGGAVGLPAPAGAGGALATGAAAGRRAPQRPQNAKPGGLAN